MERKNTKNFRRPRPSGVELIYTLFIAILIALFFGLGVSAFYPEPKAPDYPIVLNETKAEGEPTQAQLDAQTKYEQDIKSYQEAESKYSRNVSIITLILSVVALAIGLIFFENIFTISNGLLLGGVFTLMYSIIRGFMTEDSIYRFAIVTVGLIIALVIGYLKFVKPSGELEKAKR